MRIPPLLTTLVLLCLAPSPARADWSDLMKQLEKRAPSLVEGSPADAGSAPDTDTLVRGLKEALAVGTRRAVERVGTRDGYLANPAIRVPLPGTLEKGAALVRKFGGGTLVDDFETSMNRAAEQAAPQATAVLIDALQGMTIDDAQQIYRGDGPAATRYFQEKTAARLEGLFRPVIHDAMNQAQVTRYYQALVAEARRYPFVGKLDLDLESHVTAKALEGLFEVLGEEEQRIRQDPMARSTALLKQLFGP